MEHIANAMLIRSERSLDLLQGILVFLGSYHYYCMTHAQFHNMIRLAISLVEDIHLNISPASQQKSFHPPSEESAIRTNEEKRALLGVWYMSSMCVSPHYLALIFNRILCFDNPYGR